MTRAYSDLLGDVLYDRLEDFALANREARYLRCLRGLRGALQRLLGYVDGVFVVSCTLCCAQADDPRSTEGVNVAREGFLLFTLKESLLLKEKLLLTAD